jgi:hypothetical protein
MNTFPICRHASFALKLLFRKGMNHLLGCEKFKAQGKCFGWLKKRPREHRIYSCLWICRSRGNESDYRLYMPLSWKSFQKGPPISFWTQSYRKPFCDRVNPGSRVFVYFMNFFLWRKHEEKFDVGMKKKWNFLL